LVDAVAHVLDQTCVGRCVIVEWLLVQSLFGLRSSRSWHNLHRRPLPAWTRPRIFNCFQKSWGARRPDIKTGVVQSSPVLPEFKHFGVVVFLISRKVFRWSRFHWEVVDCDQICL